MLDVCAESRSMRQMLAQTGHDVRSVSEYNPTASDESVLELALQEERVLLTEDEDFGELVFQRGLQHPCIVRFVDMPIAEKLSAMQELISDHPDAMAEGNLIVVTENRIRVREIEVGN